MKMEIFADRTLAWFEQLLKSPWTDRLCWAVIVIAAWYFMPIVTCAFLK